jgi:hypothetical protein
MAYGSVQGDGSSGFANLRQVIDPRLAALPDAAIRLHMEAAYGPDAAEQYEEYLEGVFGDIGKAFGSAARDVGKFAGKAAPAIATVGGGALQGAMAGSALGLPGIIAGAAVGGAGAGLSKYGKGTARNIGGALSGVTNIAGQFSPAGRVGAGLGSAISGLAGSGKGGARGAAVNALSGVLGGLAGGAGGGGAAGAAVNALGGLLGGRGGPAAGAAVNALGGLLGGRGGPAAGAAVNALGGLLGGRGREAAGVASALGGLLGGGGGAAGGLPVAALTNLFGGSGAASQLASAIQRPEVRLALERLRNGGGGAVPIGAAQTMVPVAGIANMMRELAEQAADEAAAEYEDAESELDYMADETGEFVGDPANARDRAAQIWNLLNDAQAERLLANLVDAAQRGVRALTAEYEEADWESEEAAETAYWDAIDLAEAYALESAAESADE